MIVRQAEDWGRLARQRRRDLGISQKDLAIRAGVTRQWLVRFEQGNTEVTLSKVAAVLRELELVSRVDPAESAAKTSDGPRFAIPKITVPPLAMPAVDIDVMRHAIAAMSDASTTLPPAAAPIDTGNANREPDPERVDDA